MQIDKGHNSKEAHIRSMKYKSLCVYDLYVFLIVSVWTFLKPQPRPSDIATRWCFTAV